MAVKARCFSLEILRGRGYKGGGTALRLPLVIIGFAEDDGEVGGRWWQPVRRRPHWLHRPRESRPLSILELGLWLTAVASRLALTTVVTAAVAVPLITTSNPATPVPVVDDLVDTDTAAPLADPVILS